MSEDRATYTTDQLAAAGYTTADLSLPKKPRVGNKHGNKKTPCAIGHLHHSGIEAKRCDDLHLMLRAKEIFRLTVQPRLQLSAGFKRDGKTYRASYYIGDFLYTEPGSRVQVVCEDVKAADRKTGKPRSTAFFKDKWKRAIGLYPNIAFRIVAVR